MVLGWRFRIEERVGHENPKVGNLSLDSEGNRPLPRQGHWVGAGSVDQDHRQQRIVPKILNELADLW